MASFPKERKKKERKKGFHSLAASCCFDGDDTTVKERGGATGEQCCSIYCSRCVCTTKPFQITSSRQECESVPTGFRTCREVKFHENAPEFAHAWYASLKVRQDGAEGGRTHPVLQVKNMSGTHHKRHSLQVRMKYRS